MYLQMAGYKEVQHPRGSRVALWTSPGKLPTGLVWDSHCHLDFLSNKMRQAGIRNGEELEVALALDTEPLGEAFGGCVTNFLSRFY